MLNLNATKLALYLGSALLLVASSVPAQSGFDTGASAYKRGDYETALAVFRPLADNGDARAQSILGMMYTYGEGVSVDYREAARWYRRGAEQNSSVSQYNLGMLYLEGQGVPQSTDEAVKWLTMAAIAGHFRARSELAKLDAGSYSNQASPPSESLETPPSMTTTASEPQSVVMTKPVAPAPTPTFTPTAATAMTVNAAPTTSPTPTNNHANLEKPPQSSPQGDVNAPRESTGSTRVYHVQLASARSEEYIRRDWSGYQKRYGDIFDGLDGSVVRAEVGDEKTVWYRLRVGPFASEASAKELCQKLTSRNIKIGCLPLLTSR